MLFGGNMVRNDRLVIPSYMVPLPSISGHCDVIWKKLEKLLMSRFVVSVWFFRSNYKHVIISIVYASKWWVTWPFFHYELKNDHFDRFIGKFIPTSGLRIDSSWNDYFWDQCLLGFNLRYHKWYKLIIYRKSPKKL